MAGLETCGRMAYIDRDSALLGGAVFQVLAAENTSLLRNVSNYPFSLGWSEASRYYYASLAGATDLWGRRTALRAACYPLPDAGSAIFNLRGTDLAASAVASIFIRRYQFTHRLSAPAPVGCWGKAGFTSSSCYARILAG